MFSSGTLPQIFAIIWTMGQMKPLEIAEGSSKRRKIEKEYNAKLSDSGLAKDGPGGNKAHVSTRVMGTYSYAAPEYVMTGHLMSRSDVYSFGVVLLEILTGRRSLDKNRPNGEHNLVEWARPHLGERRRFYKLIDPRLEGHFTIKGAQKAAHSRGQYSHENAVIAEYTLRALQHTMPPAVPAVMFLSGGQSEEEATVYLNAMNKLQTKKPWSLSFSFGRALQQSNLKAWRGKEENVKKAQEVFLARCKGNSEATLGKYEGGASLIADAAESLHVKDYKY